MINQEKAKVIWLLYQEGVRSSEIAKKLGINRKTVKKIIDQHGDHNRKERSDKIILDEEIVIKTFKRCDRWGERTHEELKKIGINIAYPTLMTKIRDLGLRENQKKFSEPSPDIPGQESQHDLSSYTVLVGENKIKLQASLLHYRYSKMNYLKFYPAFNRFNMKSFFFESLNYFGYVPEICVIDNTSLVIDRGSGKNAVFNKEMVDFAKSFNFRWYAHAIKHSDRKAGCERMFYTITTNFFPGREFISLEDLNVQAKQWCESRSKKINKNKIIPIDRFEYEKEFMTKVYSQISPPYLQFTRVVGQEGYVLHRTNLYWVGIQRDMEVVVLEYPNRIKIYQKRKVVGEYDLPPFGTRQKRFKPNGVMIPYRPKKRTVPPNDEEKELRSDSITDEYLTFALKHFGPQNRYQFIRQLYYLRKNLTSSLFKKVVQRALKYKVRKKSTLEQIALYLMGKEELSFPELDLAYSFVKCEEGLYGSDPDLSSYDTKWRNGHE